jgi:hypothetical protein
MCLMSENPLLRECLHDHHVIAKITVSVIRCARLDLYFRTVNTGYLLDAGIGSNCYVLILTHLFESLNTAFGLSKACLALFMRLWVART